MNVVLNVVAGTVVRLTFFRNIAIVVVIAVVVVVVATVCSCDFIVDTFHINC